MDPKVISFYKELILKSNFMIDEDLSYYLYLDPPLPLEGGTVLRNFLLPMASVIVGSIFFWRRKDMHNAVAAATGAVLCIPISRALFLKWRNYRLKSVMTGLITSFLKFSQLQNEVFDFLKTHIKSREKASARIEAAISSIYNIFHSKSADIIGSMVDLLKIMFKDRQDVDLNLDQLGEVPLPIGDILPTLKILEGQHILLRSHLFYSIIMMLDKPKFHTTLIQIMEFGIPKLIKYLEDGVSTVDPVLDSIRRVRAPGIPNMDRLHAIISRKRLPAVPKLRKTALELTDKVTITVEKIKDMFTEVENIESDDYLDALERKLGDLGLSLLSCHSSIMEFKRILGVVNGTLQQSSIPNLEIEERVERKASPPPPNSLILEEEEEVGEYQEFSNFLNDEYETLDFAEINPATFHKNHQQQKASFEWLVALKESKEFKRRRDTYKVAPSKSDPVETPDPKRTKKNKPPTPKSDLKKTNPGSSTFQHEVEKLIPPAPPIPSVRDASELPKEPFSRSVGTSDDNVSSTTVGMPVGDDAASTMSLASLSPSDSELLSGLTRALAELERSKEETFE